MNIDEISLSNVKKTGCLGYIGDYTARLCWDYKKQLEGSLLTHQDSMESRRDFSWLSLNSKQKSTSSTFMHIYGLNLKV